MWDHNNEEVFVCLRKKKSMCVEIKGSSCIKIFFIQMQGIILT